MAQFEYVYKTTWGERRAYPLNDFARLFLALNQTRGAKTFTEKHMEHIREIAGLVGFEVVERGTE
jgi:hypothetical protein